MARGEQNGLDQQRIPVLVQREPLLLQFRCSVSSRLVGGVRRNQTVTLTQALGIEMQENDLALAVLGQPDEVLLLETRHDVQRDLVREARRDDPGRVQETDQWILHSSLVPGHTPGMAYKDQSHPLLDLPEDGRLDLIGKHAPRRAVHEEHVELAFQFLLPLRFFVAADARLLARTSGAMDHGLELDIHPLSHLDHLSHGFASADRHGHQEL